MTRDQHKNEVQANKGKSEIKTLEIKTLEIKTTEVTTETLIADAERHAEERSKQGSPNDPADIDSEHTDVMVHLQAGLLPPKTRFSAKPGGIRQGVERNFP